MITKFSHSLSANQSDDIPEFMKKLTPGHILSEIGFSSVLLSKETLSRVQDICLKNKNIDKESLDRSEQVKLQTGMAVTVRSVLKQRDARRKLFQGNLLGLRNDLALRKELRKPNDKVRIPLKRNFRVTSARKLIFVIL